MKLNKSETVAGIILAVALAIVTFMSSIFFLVTIKVGFINWISFNSCSIISILYLISLVAFFVCKKGALLVLTSLPIYFLGTMSMFIMPWDSTMLIAQIGHIIMTLNIIWVLYVLIKHKEYKALAIGLLAGMLIFVPFIAHVQTYNQKHATELSDALKGQ
jgi:hypothetical protein